MCGGERAFNRAACGDTAVNARSSCAAGQPSQGEGAPRPNQLPQQAGRLHPCSLWSVAPLLCTVSAHVDSCRLLLQVSPALPGKVPRFSPPLPPLPQHGEEGACEPPLQHMAEQQPAEQQAVRQQSVQQPAEQRTVEQQPTEQQPEERQQPAPQLPMQQLAKQQSALPPRQLLPTKDGVPARGGGAAAQASPATPAVEVPPRVADTG